MEPAIIIPKEATKWDIRQTIWDYFETNDLANFPRPVHHRIPNFKGAQGACGKMMSFEFFNKCSEMKVDPDKPLEGVRLAVLQAGKTLLVPTPRLRTGLFNKIVPPQRATKEDLRVCSMSRGIKEFSVPVGLDSKVHVDLVVVGSVAVSEKGYRIGKGEGFADMEYAMMVSMGSVNESTLVVTVVHDCQVVDIPEGLMDNHDLTVDYIFTPSRVIKTDCQIPKPQGIIWSKLDAEMLEKIPILKQLRVMEQKAGKDIALKVLSAESANMKHERQLDPKPSSDSKYDCRHAPKIAKQDRTRQLLSSGEEPDELHEPSQAPVNMLYLGSLPTGLRVSELKCVLRERGAVPVRLNWQGAQHRAFLEYEDERASDQALDALERLCIHGHELHAERAKSRKSFNRPGAPKDRTRHIPKEQHRIQRPSLKSPAAVSGQGGGKIWKM